MDILLLLFNLWLINGFVFFLSEICLTVYADEISILTTSDDAEFIADTLLMEWFTTNRLP